MEGHSQLYNRGAHIRILVFTDYENNQFQKKLIVQNMNV